MTEPMQSDGAEPPARAPAPDPVAEPEIVQWGSAGRPSRLRLLVNPAAQGWQGWRDQRVAWALAAVGGLALFGSMLETWQVTALPTQFVSDGEREVTSDLAALGAWGTAWMVVVTALVAGTGLAVFGSTALRSAARGVGLAVAGALAALLVVMTISLIRHSVLDAFAPGNDLELEPELGRGVYLAYLGVVLVAVALWWVQPQPGTAASGPAGTPGAAPAVVPRQPGPHPGPGWLPGPGAMPGPGPVPNPGAVPHADVGPADLRVGPAEPFTQPGPAPDDDPRWRRPEAGGG